MQACTPESGPLLPVQGAAAVGLGGGGCFVFRDTHAPPHVSSAVMDLGCEQLWASTRQALLNQLAGNTVLSWPPDFCGNSPSLAG